MILMFAKYGDHGDRLVFRTDADVKRYLAQRGIDFQKLVEQCRSFGENVPYLENLVGSTWTVSYGAKAAVVDMQSGEEKCAVEGPGAIALSTYWAHAETSVKSRTRAVEASSFAELQIAITNGMASIEAFISHRAEIWNTSNPQDKLIDSFADKVSFSDKIDVWVPKMTGGRNLDKSLRNWMDFQELRKIRDDVAIHPKASGMGTSFTELAKNLNLLKTGVGGLLVQLHLLFGERIPSVIIRLFFAPEAEVVEFNNDKCGNPRTRRKVSPMSLE
jgi:hypothetical protein